MKTYLLSLVCLLLLFIISTAGVPEWQWAKFAPAPNYADCISVLPSGDFYTAGNFGPPVVMGNDTIRTGGNSMNYFIAQYNSAGGVNWARAAKYNDRIVWINDVSSDRKGNVYVIGSWGSKLIVENDTLSHASQTMQGFFVKYDILGNFQWIRPITTTSQSLGEIEAWGIATDSFNNVFVTGRTTDTVLMLGSDTFRTTTGFYLAKYDENGAFKWARFSEKIGGPAVGKKVITDKEGNIIVSGYFWNQFAFGRDTLTYYGNGTNGFFVAKYDSLGNEQWARKLGGTSNNQNQFIVADKSGNIYLSGAFESSVICGNDTLPRPAIGGNDFIAKIDSSGKGQWAKKIATRGYAYPTGVFIDFNGSPYVCGNYIDTTVIANTQLIDIGSNHMFITKYNPNGQAQFVISHDGVAGLGPGGGYNAVWGAGCDASGNIYCTGEIIREKTVFGPDTLDSDGSNQFVAKAVQCLPITATIVRLGGDTLTTGFFNSYQWVYNNSPIPNATSKNHVATQPGTYQVIVNAVNNCADTSTIYLITGINSPKQEQISLFPNPATDVVNISISTFKKGAQITITDMAGRIILRKIFNQNTQYNCSDWQPGVYFVTVSDGSDIYTSRMIKQ